MKIAVCRACGKAAQGCYGFVSAAGALVKADLCAAHAQELKTRTGVVVLEVHRKPKRLAS